MALIGALGVRGLIGVQRLTELPNQRRFAFYMAQVPSPQLRRSDVLDNLAVHKSGGVQLELARSSSGHLTRPIYPG